MVRIIPLLFLFLWIHLIIKIYSIQRKRKEALRKSLNYLSGSVSKFSLCPLFQGIYQGLKFNISLSTGSKWQGYPPILTISLFKKSAFKLRVHKESFLTNLSKKLGALHKVKINDAVFEHELFISSNKPSLAINYFSNSDIKNAVRALIDGGFDSLSINSKKLSVVKLNYNLNQDLEQQKIVGILEKLSLLTKGL